MDSEIKKIIDDDNFEKTAKFFEDVFHEHLAGWNHPFTFIYHGIYRIIEEKIWQLK